MVKAAVVTKGSDFTTNPVKGEGGTAQRYFQSSWIAELTEDMLSGDNWKNVKFKKLNIAASGTLVEVNHICVGVR